MMHLFYRVRKPGLRILQDGASVRYTASIVIPFGIGILLGAVIGSFSESLPMLFLSCGLFDAAAETAGFAASFWLAIRYFLLVLFVSASLFGVVLLPGLSFLRGFLLSCEIAYCFASDSYSGLALAALRIGLPAILSIPAFLLVSVDGMAFSARLVSFSLRPSPQGPAQLRLRYSFLIFLIALLDAAYCHLFLPRLINLFF